jgi:hypothetical protein
MVQVSPKARRIVASSSVGALRIFISPDLVFNGTVSAPKVVLDEARFGDGFSFSRQEREGWSGCFFHNAPLEQHPPPTKNSSCIALISLSSLSGNAKIIAQSWQSRLECQLLASLKHRAYRQ